MQRFGKIFLFTVPVALFSIAVLFLVGAENLNPALRGMGSGASTVSLDPPEDLNFAGEPVPLRDLEVKERLETELIKNIYLHSVTFMNIKRASRWRNEMTAILAKQGIPEDFFYLCIAESHLVNATSPMGAKGFWQFMEATGKAYGLEINEQVDERYDPVKSTYAAAKYLKDAYRAFGNWTLVAASYNMGIGGVQAQLKKQRVKSYYDLYLNRETSAYVFRVLAIKSILERPENYGFILRPDQLYKPLRYKVVKVDSTINDIVGFALQQGTTYKMLKVMNPWILGDQIKNGVGDAKKTYEIHIPVDGVQDGLSELTPRGPGSDSISDSLLRIPPPTGDTLGDDSVRVTPKSKNVVGKKKKK
jgi:membrane-bound lytic murein transglycosylase D